VLLSPSPRSDVEPVDPRRRPPPASERMMFQNDPTQDRRREQFHPGVPNTSWDRIMRDLAHQARRAEVARRRAENSRLAIEGPPQMMEIEDIDL